MQCVTPRSSGAAPHPGFINTLAEAVTEVLAAVAELEVSSLGPRLKTNETYGDITGVMGLTGATERGAFAVSFGEACILRIATEMLEERCTRIDDTIIDVVGSLTNMISGLARARMAETGHDFGMAIPTVITEGAHALSYGIATSTVVVPFTSPAGPFFIEGCLLDSSIALTRREAS